MDYHIILFFLTICQTLKSINWIDAIMCVHRFNVLVLTLFTFRPPLSEILYQPEDFLLQGTIGVKPTVDHRVQWAVKH